MPAYNSGNRAHSCVVRAARYCCWWNVLQVLEHAESGAPVSKNDALCAGMATLPGACEASVAQSASHWLTKSCCSRVVPTQHLKAIPVHMVTPASMLSHAHYEHYEHMACEQSYSVLRTNAPRHASHRSMMPAKITNRRETAAKRKTKIRSTIPACPLAS